VDRLSAAKLVTRSPDPQNRRRQRIVLTGRGRRTLASIHHQWNRYYAALLARMPRSGRAAIFEGVTRLAEAVAAHPPRPPGRSPSGNRP
jgi:DNA-binding MarR family transcriptional regulator